MKKICVYTCITGEYDNLKPVEYIDKNYEYICFTNNRKITSDFWNMIYIDDENLDNLTLARKIKILGNKYLENYDITVWVDGAINILKPVSKFLKECCDLENNDMVGFNHRHRNCIYDEINACVYYYKETIENAKIVEKFLKKEKYPYNNGLIESTILVRKNKKEVNDLMKQWYEMLIKYSRRDQLSFNYCLWKNPIKLQMLDMNVFDNQYFKHDGHLLKSEKLEYCSYRIYFGDSKKFNYKNVNDSKYLKKDNKAVIKEKIKNNVQRIELKLNNELGSCIKRIKSNKKIEYTIFNVYEIGGFNYFYDEPIILIEGDFQKNDIIELEIEIQRFDNKKYVEELNNKNEIVKELLYKLNKEKKNSNELREGKKQLEKSIRDLNNNYENLLIRYNNIIYSKSWKLLKKIRKIIRIIKK